MTVSLSMSGHISCFTLPAQQHLPSLPKQSFECINETKNLERARGNHEDVFTARRVSQVNSHSQNGQQKDSLQLSRVPADLRRVRKSQSFWMTNWNITGTSASVKVRHGTWHGQAEDMEALGDSRFLLWLQHRCTKQLVISQSDFQPPPTQLTVAGLCVYTVMLEAGPDLSWGYL